jgi:AraC-like DNA-binding protein/mannose-6-phosphate isomerase-like protein (cupin superfamily)
MKRDQEIFRIDHVTSTVVYQEQFHINFYSQYPVTEKPHRHNFYEILWFPEGQGSHCIDDVCFNLTGKDLFLISEGQAHYFKNVKGLQGYLLMFKDVYWEESLQSIHNFKTTLFNHLLINAHLELADEDATEISNLMNQILKEYRMADYPNKAEVIINYLKILLIRIANMQSSTVLQSPNINKNSYKLFQQFIEDLESFYTAEREVGFYAKRLNIANSKLADICRKCNGRNPKELIEQRILIAAKRTLQFDSNSIKEIASTFSFSDQFQFSKFFKKLSGISPVEYRSQYTQSGI